MMPRPGLSLRTIAVILTLAPTIAGCKSTHHAPFDSNAPLDRASGVTLRSGKELNFASRGASIANDTLYAVGAKGQLLVPTDSIARVSTPQFSAGRTAILVVGIAAALIASFFIAFEASGGLKFNLPVNPAVR